jgi:death-on-curing protein
MRVIDVPSAESALAAPFAGFGELDFYPDPAVKAAILCSRLVRNHPFPDGNKRVAYLAMRERSAVTATRGSGRPTMRRRG